MTKFVVQFGVDTPPADQDGRLDAPAFHRNRDPILDVVARVLSGKQGHVLEIGSGTGQHIVALAQRLPDLTWWPTDPNPAHRASIDAWRRHERTANVRGPVDLDAAAPDWQFGAPGRPPQAGIAAILCINVVHIAPWPVAEGLVRMAGRMLGPHGRLILYGPYAVDGVHTAPSNAAFDASLRAQNPQWGVRDLSDMRRLAAANRLGVAEVVPMPANNLILILAPTDSPGDSPG
jgi:hypothetical protein